MKKAVILFSGQGAQFDGMGLDFYQADPDFQAGIARATQLTGLPLLKIFQNSQQASTLELQPALTAFAYNVYQLLARDLKLEVGGALGLSLGEYPALIASRALSEQAGLELVKKRAQYMEAEVAQKPGAMLAVLKPELAELERLCVKCSTPEEGVWIANYNAPKQVVVGGHKPAVDRLAQALAAANKKVSALNVAGAFHTPLFSTSEQQLKQAVVQIEWQEPGFTVFSNTIEAPFTKANLAQILPRQVAAPTHFATCLSQIVAQEKPDVLLEIGPGDALSKFARQIAKKIPRYRLDTWEHYQATLAELRN